MLTADSVLALTFPTGNIFVSGYDADAVDSWLDKVVLTLRAHEGHAEGEIVLLASDAKSVRFAARRGSSSYEPDAVDDAIDMIAATLALHEAAAGAV